MELVEPFDMTQPAISRHLKVLEGAGLIARRVDGTKRPCRLEEGGIQTVEHWLAMMRDALSQNYDRLDRVLADMQSATAPSDSGNPGTPSQNKTKTKKRSGANGGRSDPFF